MVQARLPDVNTSFITFRGEAIRSLKSNNYLSCLGSLKSLNALLPDEYRVTMNNVKYNEESKINFVYVCKHCKEETDGLHVKPFDYNLDPLESLTSKKSTIKVWKCKSCMELNNMEHTDIIKNSLLEPSFLHVVPLPPTRKDGLLGRSEFKRQFLAWAWNMLNELEERMAKFRDDNWVKNDEFSDSDLELDSEDED